MVSYKRNYLKFFDYGEQDMVPSEYSGKRATEIHHLIPRSKLGSDTPDNLIALTRDEHDKAHNEPLFNEELKRIHKRKYEAWKGSTGK